MSTCLSWLSACTPLLVLVGTKVRTISLGLSTPVSVPLASFQTLPSRPFRDRCRSWSRLRSGFLLGLLSLLWLLWVFLGRRRRRSLLRLGRLLLIVLLFWRRRSGRGRSGRSRRSFGNGDGNPVNRIPSHSSGYQVPGMFALRAMRFHVIRRHIGQQEWITG